MNKKTILIIAFALIVIVGAIRGLYLSNESNFTIQNQEESNVRSLVEDFGDTLKNVSLLSPNAQDEIEENYKDFVDRDLLNDWKENPLKALGRLTSSPWPERIEITEISKIDSNNYIVHGHVIEMTSTGESGREPIDLNIRKSDGKWLIISIVNNVAEFIENSQGISFIYPKSLNTEYIHIQSWPREFRVSEEGQQLMCNETPLESSLSQRVQRKAINENEYCISALSEGTAGTVYTEYSYSRLINNRIATLNFVLRYPACENYSDAERIKCEIERETFDLDNIIDGIFSTIVFRQNISWNEMQELILDCKIKEAFQAHSKDVEVILKNGLKLKSREPQIDDIIYLVDSVKDKCGDIRMGTE